MSLSYPYDFVKRIEDEYQDDPEVLDLARSGRFALGTSLKEGAINQMSPEEIVEAFESGKHDLVLRGAESAIRRRDLHRDWLRMMVQKVESLQRRDSERPREAFAEESAALGL